MTLRLTLLLMTASLAVSLDAANGQLLRRNRNNNNCCQNCNCNNNYQSSTTETTVASDSQTIESVPSSNAVATDVVQTSYEPAVETSYPVETMVTQQTYQAEENPVYYAPVAETPDYAPAVETQNYAPVYETPAPQFASNQFAPNQFAPNLMQNYAQSYPGQIGFRSHDVGYMGPGDMRTHLWRDHSGDLSRVGISYEQVMSMPLDIAQTWHNHFHGTEGPPNQHVGQGTFATPVFYQESY